MNYKNIFKKVKTYGFQKPLIVASGVIALLVLLQFIPFSSNAPDTETAALTNEAQNTTIAATETTDPPPEILTQTLVLNSREPRKLVIPEYIPPSQTEHPARWKDNAVKTNIPKGMAKIAIIIDDVGVNLSGAKEVIALPAPLTMALLPYADHVDTLAQDAKNAGHELMIHMPMEPMNPDLDTGPIVLKTGYTSQEFDSMLDKALKSFDGYVGLNNHMGSKLTQDPESMRRLMDRLYKEGMLFVDSRTIASSVAEKTANDFLVPNLARDVFLDDDPSAEAVHKSLMKVEQVARKYGSVVAIGHPKTETIEALKAWIPTLAEKNMVLVPVTALVTDPAAQNN